MEICYRLRVTNDYVFVCNRLSCLVLPAIFLIPSSCVVARRAPPPRFSRIFLFISFAMWNVVTATSDTRIFCARRYWGACRVCRRGKSKRTHDGMKLWEKEHTVLSLWFSHNAFGPPLTSLSVSVAFRSLAFSVLSVSVPIAVAVAMKNVSSPAVLVIWVSSSEKWPSGRKRLRLRLLSCRYAIQFGPDSEWAISSSTADEFRDTGFRVDRVLTDSVQFVNLRGHCWERRCETRPLLLRRDNKKDSQPALTSPFALQRTAVSWRIESYSCRMASKESLRCAAAQESGSRPGELTPASRRPITNAIVC